MKRLSQSRNDAQLWLYLVVKVKSDAVKNTIAYEPGMLGSWIKVIQKWSNYHGKSEQRHLEISELNGLEWANLIQMTIISSTVGKNPLGKME